MKMYCEDTDTVSEDPCSVQRMSPVMCEKADRGMGSSSVFEMKIMR